MDPDHDKTTPKDAARVITEALPPQVHASAGRFLPDLIRPKTSLKAGPGKPAACLWTSTHTPDAEHLCDWQRWCDSEEYGFGVCASIITVGPARIFTIDGLDALTEFMTRQVINPTMADFAAKHGVDNYSVDWTATTRAWDADALRVTYDGHWETRYTLPFNTYGWDCESTAWIVPPPVLRVEYLDGRSPRTLEVSAS